VSWTGRHEAVSLLRNSVTVASNRSGRSTFWALTLCPSTSLCHSRLSPGKKIRSSSPVKSLSLMDRWKGGWMDRWTRDYTSYLKYTFPLSEDTAERLHNRNTCPRLSPTAKSRWHVRKTSIHIKVILFLCFSPFTNNALQENYITKILIHQHLSHANCKTHLILSRNVFLVLRLRNMTTIVIIHVFPSKREKQKCIPLVQQQQQQQNEKRCKEEVKVTCFVKQTPEFGQYKRDSLSCTCAWSKHALPKLRERLMRHCHFLIISTG